MYGALGVFHTSLLDHENGRGEFVGVDAVGDVDYLDTRDVCEKLALDFPHKKVAVTPIGGQRDDLRFHDSLYVCFTMFERCVLKDFSFLQNYTFFSNCRNKIFLKFEICFFVPEFRCFGGLGIGLGGGGEWFFAFVLLSVSLFFCIFVNCFVYETFYNLKKIKYLYII